MLWFSRLSLPAYRRTSAAFPRVQRGVSGPWSAAGAQAGKAGAAPARHRGDGRARPPHPRRHHLLPREVPQGGGPRAFALDKIAPLAREIERLTVRQLPDGRKEKVAPIRRQLAELPPRWRLRSPPSTTSSAVTASSRTSTASSRAAPSTTSRWTSCGTSTTPPSKRAPRSLARRPRAPRRRARPRRRPAPRHARRTAAGRGGAGGVLRPAADRARDGGGRTSMW